MKTRFKILIPVALVIVGSLLIASKLLNGEDAQSSKGNANNGKEFSPVRSKRIIENSPVHRSKSAIQELSVIDQILNKYQNLSGKYTGEELENRRLDLIGLESRKLYGSEICDLIDRVSDEFGESAMIRLSQVAINALDSAVDEQDQERVLIWFAENPNPAFKLELISEAAKMYAVSESKNPIPLFAMIKESPLKDKFSADFTRAYGKEHGIIYSELSAFSSDSKTSPELARAILECKEIEEPESIRKSLEKDLNIIPSDVAGALLSKWIDINSEAAVKYIFNTKGEKMDSVISNAFKLSPNTAKDLIAISSGRGENADDLNRIVRIFSKVNPTLAWESVSSLTDSELSAALKLSVYEEWSRIDEEKAIDDWNGSVIENR